MFYLELALARSMGWEDGSRKFMASLTQQYFVLRVTSVIRRAASHRLTVNVHRYSVLYITRIERFEACCEDKRKILHFSEYSNRKSKKRTAIFWVVTQRVVIISYQRFGTTCWLHLQRSFWLLDT